MRDALGVRMYVFGHEHLGEKERLREMSTLLDPYSRFAIGRSGVGEGWSCLEIGAGNGSLSAWLSEVVGPTGSVIATDLDTSLLTEVDAGVVRVQPFDVTEDQPPAGGLDLIVARAVIHHLPERRKVLRDICGWVSPGGWVYLEEPDFGPAQLVENPTEREFWRAFVGWAETSGIDYSTGGKVPRWMAEAGMSVVYSEARTRMFNGASAFARYLGDTVDILRDKLEHEGGIDGGVIDELLRLYGDPSHWTSPLAFGATVARRPE